MKGIFLPGHSNQPRLRAGLLPIAVAVVLCVTVFILWRTLDRDARENQRIRMETDTQYHAAQIQADLKNRFAVLDRMARRWEIRGGTPYDEFASDVRSYLADIPGFQAIGRVDTRSIVRWVVPLEGNEKALGLNLSFEENRRNAMRIAEETRMPTISQPVDLVQGGKGLLVFFPLVVRGHADGCILAVFRVNEWLNDVFRMEDRPELREDSRVAVFFDGQPLYQQEGWESLAKNDFHTEAKAEVLDHNLSVRVRATQSFMRHSRTPLPDAAAGFGAVLSALLVFVILLFQRAHGHHLVLESEMKERLLAEAALRASDSQVRLLLNSTGEAIYGIDRDGNCTFANPACARLLGYADARQFLGRHMHTLIHHSYADGRPMPVDACKMYQAFREGRGVRVDDEVLWRSDGTSFPAEYRSYPQVEDGSVKGAVVTFTDITERKQAEETIRHLATHDSLTNLPTMRLVKDRLAMAMASAQRSAALAAVMFVDLDGFKAVNDTLGHDAGDDVLREVARRFSVRMRKTDTAARIGGDEFLLIFAGIQSSDNAARLAAGILESIARPIDVRSGEARVGASIGIALYPGDGDNADILIKRADQAMYSAKASGKNRHAFAGADGPGEPGPRAQRES